MTLNLEYGELYLDNGSSLGNILIEAFYEINDPSSLDFYILVFCNLCIDKSLLI